MLLPLNSPKKMLNLKMEKDPVPFYAKAGDLLIYHPLLLHAPSSNVSAKPSLAVAGKWGSAINSALEPHYDFSKNMDHYWDFTAHKSLRATAWVGGYLFERLW